MANITFAPSGQTFNTDLCFAQKGPTSAPPNPPEVPVVSLEDQLTSGTLSGQVQGFGQNYIIWKGGSNLATVDRWAMDSEQAVEDGLAAIQTAMGADTSITLLADGTAS